MLLTSTGIEGAFHETGQKTVIPSKVTGKFSIRIVPDMSPDKVTELVVKHVNNLWAVRGSPNDMTYVSIHLYLSLYFINRLHSLRCL